MKKSWLLLILPVLLLLWWVVSRSQSAPVVHFATVRRTTIESTVSTNGKAEPAQWAAARAQTSGVVRSVLVERGQIVKAGQILIGLDHTSAQSDLISAQAREQEAKAETSTLGQGGKAATLASIEDSIKTGQTVVQVTQRNYDSIQRLQTQGAATKLQVDEARDAFNRAKLQLAAAENQKRTLVSSEDRAVAQAKLHDAQAAVQLASHRLSLQSIESPIEGVIYDFNLKIGSFLQPGEQVALVGNLNQMKVTVYVDEPDLGRVSKGMQVRITWEARPQQTWWGHIDHMPTEVVALGSRTVGEVTTLVDNPDHDLLPGVTVNATVISKVAQSAIAIPKAALRTLNGRTGVYKLAGDRMQWTPVQAGVSDINNVQVLAGLKEADRVADRVVDPSDAEISDGMRAKPVFE